MQYNQSREEIARKILHGIIIFLSRTGLIKVPGTFYTRKVPGTFLDETIAKFLKYHENIEVSSPLTLKAYKTDLKQAFVNCEKSIIKQISGYNDLWPACRNALNQWGKLSLASRNRKIATLKSFFNWLYRQRYLDKNYADLLVCPKIPKKIPHFLSVDEVVSVLKFLSNQKLKDQKHLQTKTLFLLLYGGGLRISEACTLTWQQVQWNERRLLIKGKGNKERFAVVPEFTMQSLNHLHNLTKSEFVFGEKALNPRIGYQMIHDLGKKVGLMNALHPHALRHSFATHMLASGANLRTLQTLLGHESLQATEKYTHLSVDQLARLVDQTHPLSKLKLG